MGTGEIEQVFRVCRTKIFSQPDLENLEESVLKKMPRFDYWIFLSLENQCMFILHLGTTASFRIIFLGGVGGWGPGRVSLNAQRHLGEEG